MLTIRGLILTPLTSLPEETLRSCLVLSDGARGGENVEGWAGTRKGDQHRFLEQRTPTILKGVEGLREAWLM